VPNSRPCRCEPRIGWKGQLRRDAATRVGFGEGRLSTPTAAAHSVDPPAHAVVLSIDEKSQIQALDRTQPGLPIKPGRCQTMTHDYKRNGTTTLFAALSVLDGTVIGRCMQRHRHLEFIRFLNAVERQVAAGKPIHVVLDNYATHKHPKVLAWLARHPRWTFHFIPTSASWLNGRRELLFQDARQRIRRGVFHSIADLQAASRLISPNTMPVPNLSSGPNPPTLFWPNSTAALYSIRAGKASYPGQPRAYSPRKTRAVPAVMRPMLKPLPACPIRFSVSVSPITTKPARVRMFMPKRMSLVSTAFALGGVLPAGAEITALARPRHCIR
jgi:DDE superfamily endonuclease